MHWPYVAHGQWTQDEAKLSSTWRELKAVSQVLESIEPQLMHARLRWFADDQNVVQILQVGSRKHDLQLEVIKVLNLALLYQIRLEPSWIPRENNQTSEI